MEKHQAEQFEEKISKYLDEAQDEVLEDLIAIA